MNNQTARSNIFLAGILLLCFLFYLNLERHESASFRKRSFLEEKFEKNVDLNNVVADKDRELLARGPPIPSPLSPQQKKRGYESMMIQLSKPLTCPVKGHWRGIDAKSISVETRLDEAFATRNEWTKKYEIAVKECDNGAPMMEPREIGLLFNLLREG